MFSLGYFLSNFKIARVIPIYKSGSKEDPVNYRSISFLGVFSKIFEKAVVNKLTNYLSAYTIISNSQHVFRSYYSTTSALFDGLNY